VLNVKLPHLDKWNDLRREHAARYGELLKETELVLPREMPYARHVYHLYVVQTNNREELQQSLRSGRADRHTLSCTGSFATRLCFARLQRGAFLKQKNNRRACSLPMFPELTIEQIQRVAEVIGKAKAEV
jgi:dTDP-4-amino-4,6-dideoxygalactose transaminase